MARKAQDPRKLVHEALEVFAGRVADLFSAPRRARAADWLLEDGRDPFDLIEAVEDDGSDDDAYWLWVESLTRSALADLRACDVDEEVDACHLRQTRGGMSLEGVARRVGFVIGFEYAKRLLMAEVK